MAKIHDQNVTVYPLEQFRLSAMHSTGNATQPYFRPDCLHEESYNFA